MNIKIDGPPMTEPVPAPEGVKCSWSAVFYGNILVFAVDQDNRLFSRRINSPDWYRVLYEEKLSLELTR